MRSGQLSEEVLSYIGEAVGVSWKDMNDTDPADVGLHGVPTKDRLNAYHEGCRDMASGIVSRLPESERESAVSTINKAVLEASGRAAIGIAKTTISQGT